MNMRHIFIPLAVVFVLSACSVDSIYENPTDEQMGISGVSSTRTSFSFDSDVYYHDATGLVLQAYDIFDNPQVYRVEDRVDGITHLGVKFFPKDISEQDVLSRTDVTAVSYIPFGFSPVPPDRVTPNGDVSSLPSFPEINPHTIDKSRYISVSQTRESEGSKTIRLPIMYALWPINETLPANIEYEVCFKAIIPEKEDSPDRLLSHRQYDLELVSYDALLDTEVPLGNVKVMLTYDMNTEFYYTNSSGFVSMCPSFIDFPSSQYSLLNVVLILESDDWRIAGNSTSGPIHHYLGTTGVFWFSSSPTTFTSIRTSNTTEYEIHRAVNYYFNANHSLSQGMPTYGNKITIHAMDEADSYPAVTIFDTELNTISIEVNNGYDSQNDCIASVLHELGHTRMLEYKQFAVQSCSMALVESYASFIGWYLGNSYYTSKGFVIPSSGYEISYQGRQEWTPGSGNYTPFFVDLIDDYNQPAINDPISGFSPVLMDSLGLASNSISDCATYLSTNFPSDSLSNYITYYTGL